ncbi:MAG: hypothetical protein DMG57_22275 [Acidobacteria bacterium]|nr:MAG: hypothetical protein DMG57_22275 [Acidobacteriota bacterium]
MHTERDSQAEPFGHVKSQLPDGMQIELAGPALHVTPVTADIQDVNERKRREFFDVLLDGFLAAARRKRRPAFFPGVTHQSAPSCGWVDRRVWLPRW